MTTTLLRAGTIIDHTRSRPGAEAEADVLVDDETGSIVAVRPAAGADADSDLTADNVLDATGCVIAPGFVDLNTHLRQPGNEAAETVESGSRAAALGGYTAVVAMPDTDPVADSAAVVAEIAALATSALCEIHPAGALSVGREGSRLAPFGELADAGVSIFTDAGRSITDAGLMRRALEYLSGVGHTKGLTLTAATRCELGDLARDAQMNEGEWSSRLGLAGQPAAAEELIVARELALVRLTGTRIHLQQISTMGSVALIRQAKGEGVPVTAEVSPHHLLLDESACATYDPNVKVQPPLRTRADVEALRAGLLDGTIDAIATGHSPHTYDSKELPFDQAPFGVVGLETALAVLVSEPAFQLVDLIGPLSWQPAAIAGLSGRQGAPVIAGSPANLVVIDPEESLDDRAEPISQQSRKQPVRGSSGHGSGTPHNQPG